MDTIHQDPADTLGTVRTSDLYEAAYYLSEGFPPEAVTCRKLNREVLCDFHFTGRGLDGRQINFLTNKAVVNLMLFRRSYGEIANYANNAKRDFRREEKTATGSPATDRQTVSSRRVSG